MYTIVQNVNCIANIKMIEILLTNELVFVNLGRKRSRFSTTTGRHADGVEFKMAADGPEQSKRF